MKTHEFYRNSDPDFVVDRIKRFPFNGVHVPIYRSIPVLLVFTYIFHDINGRYKKYTV